MVRGPLEGVENSLKALSVQQLKTLLVRRAGPPPPPHAPAAGAAHCLPAACWPGAQGRWCAEVLAALAACPVDLCARRGQNDEAEFEEYFAKEAPIVREKQELVQQIKHANIR